jgi:hypothetical protein
MNRQLQLEKFLLAAHRLALVRLRAQPERIEPVRAQLERWRQQAGATRSDVYWDEWQLLLTADLNELEHAVCADDEHGAVLRSVSPMSTLISQTERLQLLAEARST